MNRTRAERRALKFKFRARTKKIVQRSFYHPLEEEQLERLTVRREQHRRQCSCLLCRSEKYRDQVRNKDIDE